MSSSTTNSERAFRRYLGRAALALLALLSPLALSLLVLWRGDELAALDAVVAAQVEAVEAPILYGSAVHANEREHHMAALERRRPEVVALGSSRMEQMRQPYFDAPFVCLCTIMGAIEDAEPLIDQMLARGRPKVVLFGVDYWWFVEGKAPPSAPMLRAAPNQLTLQKALAPLGWLMEGRLSGGQAAALLFDDPQPAVAPGYRAMGIAARLNGRGVRADGSALHADMLFSAEPVRDSQRLEVVRRRIAEGHPLYAADQRVDPARIALMERAVARLRSAGVEVYVLLPPMLGRVVDWLQASPQHAYVAAVRQALAESSVAVHDFHDARSIGAQDCEFLDDRHAGDVAMMRIVAELTPPPGGAPLWRPQRLRRLADDWRGRALAPFEPERYAGPERDFLNLGCAKAGG